MLTSMLIRAQNISAVENGRHGCGNPVLSGALRHLSGGIFVRMPDRLFYVEACGHVNSWPRTGKGGFPPRKLSAPSPWKVIAGFCNLPESIMTRTSIGTSVPVLSIVKNQATALSTDVAQFFGKVHKNVLRDIENLLNLLPVSRRLNFEPLEISRASNLGNGSTYLTKAYRMTRDGFTLLVMGWTGEKALQFKLAWLDAFNKMEEELRAKNTVQALPSSSPLGKSVAPAIAAAPMLQGQLQCIQLAMRDRFPYQHDLLRAYSIMQHHFCVTSYRQIPAARFDEVMGYIKTLVLNPVRAKRPKALPAPQSSELLVARFGITIMDGEPKIYELGENKWHMVNVGSYEWVKAYCENRLPADQVPDLLKALLRRLSKETN